MNIRSIFVAFSAISLAACSPQQDAEPKEKIETTQTPPRMSAGDIAAHMAGDQFEQRDLNGTGKRTTYTSPDEKIQYSDSQGKYIPPKPRK